MLFRAIAIYLIFNVLFDFQIKKKKIRRKKNNKKNYTIKTEEKSKRIRN